MRREVYVALLVILLLYLARENINGALMTTATIATPTAGMLMTAATAASTRTGSSSLQVQFSSPPPPLQQQTQSLPATSPPAVASSLSAPPPPPTCTDLHCAARFTKVEPEWAQLSFQPRIDWHAGGVRGDCVAGELEYIMPKYCSPVPRSGNWPSEERLNAIDVHSADKPKADLAEIVRLLPNRTLLLMGDSVMEQFYNTLQCFLRREGIELPNDAAFLKFVADTAPLWRMGKRKKPPKLPQRAVGNTRLLYARVTTYQPDEVLAAIGTADVVILNWGLHYQKMGDYTADLRAAFKVLDAHASKPGRAVLFQETGAQHFKASDARGYTTGEWENRDKSADTFCTCQPIEDFNVNVRNRVLNNVLESGEFSNVKRLPFYELTRPRWRWHFGNCTHRPNGKLKALHQLPSDWASAAVHSTAIMTPYSCAAPSVAFCCLCLHTGWNYETCCDCTHFCFSPAMWHAQLHQIKVALRESTGIRLWQAAALRAGSAGRA